MTNTDIVRRDTDSWVELLGPVGTLAGNIADTEFVPKSLRGKTAAVAACILTGRELGIGPMESLQKIYVVEGRPSMSSELMRSLIQRDGHELAFRISTNDKCTLAGRRRGSQEWTEVTWTMADAQRIGVANKDTWKKYPRTMLANRATSELARLMFADVLSGISYTPEEIEDELASQPITVTRDEKPKKIQRARVQQPAAVEPSFDTVSSDVDVVAVDGETGEIIEEGVVVDEPMTKTQEAALLAAFNAAGFRDKDARLGACIDIIGRTIEHAKDLTAREADEVIAALAESEEPTDAAR